MGLLFTDVNMLEHYWTAQGFLPHPIKSNHGIVVMVASVAAWVTVPQT
jgi:NADP-dependent 3-hydroxy acid dehydrogenase YdfG